MANEKRPAGARPIAIKLLVVGATGSIGQEVLQQALRQGCKVRALVRDAAQAKRVPAGVEVAVGDLTRADTLDAAVESVDGIVFTHGSNGRPPGAEAVDYGAVRNVLAALKGRAARIALMTTIGVTDRKGAHDWKRRGERLVRASGLPHTIVRPGWFDMNADDQRRLVMLQGDRRQSGTPRDGVIARDQLAQVLVWSLRSQTAAGKTFELVAERGPATEDLDAVASALHADVANALDGVEDANNMPLQGEPHYIRTDLDKVCSEFAHAA
jgi:uncharacterized protein YbjT (DUF2867 family)